MLLVRFLPVPALRNLVTQCLTEIVGLESSDVPLDKIRQLYISFMQIVTGQLGDVGSIHFFLFSVSVGSSHRFRSPFCF